jgi:hypothetical protein
MLTVVESFWIVYSGASRHMSRERDIFASYEEIPLIKITAAKGSIKAVGIGIIRLNLNNSKGKSL